MIATGSGTKEENKLSATAERFCRRFSLAELLLATEDFSEAHLIGNGGFGKVYRGQIDNWQQTVAIKRLAPDSNQGEGEFLTEIETLSMLRHVNLVSLIGYCNENREMILVYEYIPRGTLADHLYKLSRSSESDDCSFLTWKQRLIICVGAGRGLDYLHTGTSIIHRDVKSTNILLDENFTAKVSDFGLAKHLSTSNSKSNVSTIVKGSFGYLDPIYFLTCRLTQKSDTYAFGVVLLEVLCGRPAVDKRLGEDEMSLVMWAQEKISKGKIEQIVALNLRDEISADCLKTFVGIVKRCLNHEPKKRPTMAQVVVQLDFVLEQQNRGVLLLNASRFLPFWNRVKPSGSRAAVSNEKDHKRVDVHTLPTAIPSVEHVQTANVLPNVVAGIPMHELKEITNNFSSEYLIGEELYSGALKNGHVAAIKKMPCVSSHEFLNQASLISNLKHENVAQLLGYCLHGDDLQFLAYEFAPNGSLHDILHGKHGVRGSKPGPALSWGQRVKISIMAAKGLEYIHEKERVHCNIKSSNILLFEDYQVAKIADFGPSTLFARETRSTSETQSTRESLLDSDYYHPSVHLRHACYSSKYNGWSGEVSWKGDVYYFGVLLLELLTGRKLYDDTRPRGQQHLVIWATPRLSEDKVMQVVDGRLDGDYPPNAVAKMAAIAALCVQDEAEYRPVMSVVVRALRLILLEKQ